MSMLDKLRLLKSNIENMTFSELNKRILTDEDVSNYAFIEKVITEEAYTIEDMLKEIIAIINREYWCEQKIEDIEYIANIALKCMVANESRYKKELDKCQEKLNLSTDILGLMSKNIISNTGVVASEILKQIEGLDNE